MNTFFYFKNPQKGFTTTQLQSIHKHLRNIGYEKSFQEFYAELAKVCEDPKGEVGENLLLENKGKTHNDYSLTDKEMAPLIAEHIFSLMETYAHPDIKSKVFALSGEPRKALMNLLVPTIYFTKKSIIEYLSEVNPDLVPFVKDVKGFEYLPGYASPVTEKINTLNYLPKEEKVSGVILGFTQKKRLSNEGTTSGEKELQKVAIVLRIDEEEYQIPIYQTEFTGNLYSSFEKHEGVLLAEKKVLLTMQEYINEMEEIKARPTFSYKIEQP